MDPTVIISFLKMYGYPLMFILMYFEGPIVTFIAAFLTSFGFFNLAIVWSLSFLGDFLSDLVHFSIGHRGYNFVVTKLERDGLTHRVINKLQNHLQHNLFTSLFLIKLSPPPLSSGGLFLTGTLKNKRMRAILYSAIISLILESLMITLGFFSGSYFHSILARIKETSIILMFFTGLIILFFVVKQIISKISEKMVENNNHNKKKNS